MKVFEHKEKKTNPWTFSLSIGLSAGLIWGGFKVLFYYFEFTKVVPGFMVEPYFRHRYLTSVYGIFFGWGVFIFFSIIAAFIYTALLRKAKGPWPGVLYGAGWWFIWFILIGPISGMVKRVDKLDVNTLTSELCLFILWGLFIGYTVSEEFNELRHNQPNDAS